MLNVGLSGNIGAGKSTVARWLREWGATLIDSDELVREVQLPGSETLSAIARRFGADILKPDGSLDRDVLRTRAMRDAQTLTALNEIVHPAVQQHCVLVNDIPLLFEVLDPGDFDVVVLVDAPEALRRERIMGERGLSQDVAQRMIDAQLPAAEKRARSGIVLDNDGSLEGLESVTLAAWRDIRRRAAVALTRKTGLLLAVATDQREAVHAFGGTLARYGDAGVETWLAYVGSHSSAGVAQPLGLGGTVILDEKEVAGEVERVIRKRRPDVTVTVSPALSDTVRGAWDAAGSPGTLFYTARAGATVNARLDVRPWRDVRWAALEALGERDGTAASEAPDRETFAAAVPV
jgi:dephospho-CoA kinase